MISIKFHRSPRVNTVLILLYVETDKSRFCHSEYCAKEKRESCLAMIVCFTSLQFILMLYILRRNLRREAYIRTLWNASNFREPFLLVVAHWNCLSSLLSNVKLTSYAQRYICLFTSVFPVQVWDRFPCFAMASLYQCIHLSVHLMHGCTSFGGSHQFVSSLYPVKLESAFIESLKPTISPQVGSDSLVGEGTSIGEKVGIKRSFIGKHCTISEKVKVTNSIIFDHVTIQEG